MEADRQRRLSVENRLQELRARHGRDLEDQALPDWLDHMPEPAAQTPPRRPPVPSVLARPKPAQPDPPVAPAAPVVRVGDLDV